MQVDAQDAYKRPSGFSLFSPASNSISITQSTLHQAIDASSTQSTNMFTKLIVMALAAIASVTATSASTCAQSNLQCCNTVQSAQSEPAAGLLALLGINAQSITGPVGVTCSPITGIGVGIGGWCV